MDRILLVEDDVEVRPLLEHILMDNGFQVTTAESVASATTLLSSQPFDLAICDVKLPDGSGLTVADKAIAARSPLPATLSTPELRSYVLDEREGCELLTEQDRTKHEHESSESELTQTRCV